MPVPLRNYLVTISYHDPSIFHNIITGRSVTGVLNILNKSHIDYHSKKQSTVETATYGSEYSSDRTCVEQILDLRISLRHLGAPILKLSYMFGDNGIVVNSSMNPQWKINKKACTLSFYRSREGITAKIMSYQLISGKINPVDIGS